MDQLHGWLFVMNRPLRKVGFLALLGLLCAVIPTRTSVGQELYTPVVPSLPSDAMGSVVEHPLALPEYEVKAPTCESQILAMPDAVSLLRDSGGDISLSEFCGTCGDDQLQKVVVRKNVLGCLETISVLPQDEVWLVSARSYLCGETDLSRLCVCRLENNQFVPSTFGSLTQAHASNDAKSTVFYVHGNQTSLEYAISRGLQVYRNSLATKAQCRGPVRYVIWAWKSEQEKVRYYPDYLAKSQRSVLVGETFAEALNRFSDRNMVLFGYSLGVQVLLSGLDSKACDPRPGDGSKYQVAFAAPAINANFLARHGLCQTESPVARTYVFTNRKDKAIKVAQAIVRRQTSFPDTSIVGLSASGKLNVGPVEPVDVFGETGRFHSIERYTRSDTLQLKMAGLVNEVASRRGAIVLRSGPTPAVHINPAPVVTVVPELLPNGGQ